MLGRVAVGTEHFHSRDLRSESIAITTLLDHDQMRITVSLNKSQNLVLGHLNTGIVVVSELERLVVVITVLERLVGSVEDEDLARHLSLHIATHNDDFVLVKRGTK